jgi:transcriptional regulator GlxA family with amidase domain
VRIFVAATPDHPSRFGTEQDGSVMPPDIAILALPSAGASTIYGMYDFFMSAGRDWALVTEGRPGPQLLAPRVVTEDGATVIAGNGIPVRAEAALADCPQPDLICIPELMMLPDEPWEGRYRPALDWLRAAYGRGSIIATACSGSILLAEAGLLDGCDATTHWAFCDRLRGQYPRIRVHPERALVTAGTGQRLVMAGGGTSWLDLALYLIARLAGVDAAMQVARVHLVNWNDIGQQPFARLAQSRQSQDRLVAQCQQWIATRYAGPAPVARMARHSGLSERAFARRFRQATGMPPLEYVHTLRLEDAKQKLESGDAPVEAIAEEVGYEDAAFFSRLFRRKVGLTPVQYRRRFGGLRRRLSERH